MINRRFVEASMKREVYGTARVILYPPATGGDRINREKEGNNYGVIHMHKLREEGPLGV